MVLIAAVAWLAILVVVLGLCVSAAQGDALGDPRRDTEPYPFGVDAVVGSCASRTHARVPSRLRA